jgi:glucose dehydrogenase
MAEYDADVIVVGSGSLGSLTAQEIARAGRSVIVLEAGPDIPDWKATENYRTSARKNNFSAAFPDLPYAPGSYGAGYVEPHLEGLKVFPGTLRTVGGTSRHWTAATWRLMPEDMAIKSTFGIARNWPFSYHDFEPFYTAAEYEIGVNGMDGFDESGQGRGSAYPPRSKPFPTPPEAKPYAVQRLQKQIAPLGYRGDIAPSSRLSVPYEGRPACVGNNICNWNCPIGAKHSGYHVALKIRKLGVEIRANAIVDKLEVGSGGRIVAVSYLSPDGTRKRLTAKIFVLATHGFETPKLLLLNELATRSGMVGRNLMIHPTIDMTWLSQDPYWVGRGQNIHGAIMQRRNQLDRATVPSTRYDLLNGTNNLSIADTALRARSIGAALDQTIRDQTAHMFTVEALTEDLPDPSNRVEVNPGFRDALGQPGIKLHYKISDYTKANLPRLMDDFANFLQATNGKRVSAPTIWICQHHIIGTVRMGSDAADSVVDKDLRCFDHQNLFLVTTGVMPTSGGVNPTLTGMALAMRAGRTIAAEV